MRTPFLTLLQRKFICHLDIDQLYLSYTYYSLQLFFFLPFSVLRIPQLVMSSIFSVVNVVVPSSQMMGIYLSSLAFSSLILPGLLMKPLNKEYTL